MSSRKLTPFRKKYLKFKVSEKRRLLKLEAIEYKGGKCERCGYCKCPSALVFHHTDPSQKEFGIAEKGRSHRNLNAIKNELDKCILICQNCHAEIHAEEAEKNRLLKFDEIQAEKRKSEPSKEKKCDTCSNIIQIFASAERKNNFCSVKCKKAFTFNDGWPSYNDFLSLKEKMSPKELAKHLNKPLSSIYDRITQMPLTQDQALLFSSFVSCKKNNNDVRSSSDPNNIWLQFPTPNGYPIQTEIFSLFENLKWIEKKSLGWEMTDLGYKMYTNINKINT